MRRIPPPPARSLARDAACRDAMEPAFEQLVARCVLAGWTGSEVREALLALALAEVAHPLERERQAMDA